MNKFSPWTIENGTLQLLPWEGGIYDRCGNQLGVGCELGMGRIMRMDDLLAEFFRHIDANPQTTFHLVTEHPERERDAWPPPNSVENGPNGEIHIAGKGWRMHFWEREEPASPGEG